MNEEEEIEGVEAEEEKSSGSYLTPAQWEEVKSKYELGQADAGELSRAYKIPVEALRKRFHRAGVRKGSRIAEVKKVVDDSIKRSHGEAVREFTSKREEHIEDTKKEHYAWSRFLGQQIVAKVNEARTSGRSVADVYHEIKTLRLAAAGVGDVLKQRFDILGVDQDDTGDDLQDLPIQVLTDKEIETLRSAQDEDDVGALELEEDDIVEEDD